MILRIEPNARNVTKATAWAGQVHAADLHRERDAKRAKLQRMLPPLATAAELRLMADLCCSVADSLDSWTS